MFKGYTDGNRIINATPRAYEVLYKNKGFKELEFIRDIDEAHDLAIYENNIKYLKGLKVDELKELAKEREIESYSNMRKEDLLAALRGE